MCGEVEAQVKKKPLCSLAFKEAWRGAVKTQNEHTWLSETLPGPPGQKEA